MEIKTNKVKVLVASTRSILREGIVGTLSGESEIRVVGKASSRLELIEEVDKLAPDIVIIDGESDADVSSLETINLINQKSKHIKILLMSKDYDEEKELAALKMGVSGFLPENVGKADFIKCIRAINNGEMWVRRRVMEKLLKQLLALDTSRK